MHIHIHARVLKRFAKCFVIHIDKWMGPHKLNYCLAFECILNQAKQTQNSYTSLIWVESSYYYGKSNRYACLLHRSPLLFALYFVSSLPCAMKTIVKEWKRDTALRYIAHIYDYHIICPTIHRWARTRTRLPAHHLHTLDIHGDILATIHTHQIWIIFYSWLFFIVIHIFFSSATETTLVQYTSQRCYLLCAVNVLPFNVNISGAFMQRSKPKIVQNLYVIIWELDL